MIKAYSDETFAFLWAGDDAKAYFFTYQPQRLISSEMFGLCVTQCQIGFIKNCSLEQLPDLGRCHVC